METNPVDARVFVVVPSYNHERYVGECLRSVMGQTVRPRKLLVIDDGSRDASLKVIEAALKECPFDSELVSGENRGLSAVLNDGLERSSGDFFAYIGSDDVWSPRFIERRIAALSERPSAALAYGHAYLIDEDGFVTDNSAMYEGDWADFPEGDPWPLLSYGNSPVSSTVLYRRSALLGLRWNESARLEDFEMYLRISQVGGFIFDPEILSGWRRHGANTSRDSGMMLTEILGALARAERDGVISAGQRGTAEARTRFRFAREALQHCRRRRAIELALGNFRGARSALHLLAFGLRLAVPAGIVNLRRRLGAAREKTHIQDAF